MRRIPSEKRPIHDRASAASRFVAGRPRCQPAIPRAHGTAQLLAQQACERLNHLICRGKVPARRPFGALTAAAGRRRMPNCVARRRLDSLALVPSITDLDLSNNALKRLSGISALTQLRRLNVSSNCLVTVRPSPPDSLRAARSLGGPRLHQLQDVTGNAELEELIVRQNRIGRVASGVAALARLRVLDLAFNKARLPGRTDCTRQWPRALRLSLISCACAARVNGGTRPTSGGQVASRACCSRQSPGGRRPPRSRSLAAVGRSEPRAAGGLTGAAGPAAGASTDPRVSRAPSNRRSPFTLPRPSSCRGFRSSTPSTGPQ